MARKRRRTYSWALAFSREDPDVQRLSKQALDGFEWATSFAKNARERSTAALRGELPPERLTAEELAAGWTSAIRIHEAIKQARIELFGKDLSNSAIAYRLKQRRTRTSRICAEPGCQKPISALAHGRRRFCAWHGSAHARVARHRWRSTLSVDGEIDEFSR